MDDSQRADHNLRAISNLDSLLITLRENPSSVPVAWIESIEIFNLTLDHLASAGENVDEFRIPREWINQPNPGGKASIDREALTQRVQAVRGYLILKNAVQQVSDETGQRVADLIGFKAPVG